MVIVWFFPGQWDMVTNLIEKHGVMPKDCFPETISNENSRSLNRILKSKLREYAFDLFKAVEQDATDDTINAMIKDTKLTINSNILQIRKSLSKTKQKYYKICLTLLKRVSWGSSSKAKIGQSFHFSL